MNKQRRKEVIKLSKRVEDLLSVAEILRDDIESVKMEEDEAYDNLPEPFQYSERGEEMEQNVDHLDDVFSSLDDVCSSLDDAIEYFNELL